MGKAPLWVAFWCYYVVGCLLVVGSPFLLVEQLEGLPEWGLLTYAVFEILYVLWAHIVLFACAQNTDRNMLGYAARAYVLAAVAFTTWQVALKPRGDSQVDFVRLKRANDQ